MDKWANLTEEELMAAVGGHEAYQAQLEMQRRLIASNRQLKEAIDGFRVSADKWSKWVVALTLAIAALTVVLVVVAITG